MSDSQQDANERPRTEPLPQPELGELFGRQAEKEQLQAWCDQIEAHSKGKIIFLTGQQMYEPALLASWLGHEADARGWVVQECHMGGETDTAAWIKLWRDLALRKGINGSVLVSLTHVDEQAEIWVNPLTKFAIDIQEVPLLLLIPLHLPVPLATLPEAAYPWHRMAKGLLARQLAHEMHVEALTLADVQDLTEPCHPYLPQLLHGLSRGEPRLVRDVWQNWQEAGLVWPDADGVWQTDTRSDNWLERLQKGYSHLVQAQLLELLQASTYVLQEEAEEMLAIAALEGESFTLEAVLGCMGVAVGSEEMDEWIDFCDDCMAVGEAGDGAEKKMLVPAGDVEGSSLAIIGYPQKGQKPRTVNRYRFAKPYLHWGWQQRQGVGEALVAARCEQLAEQLVAVYTPHLQLVLDALTRLYEAAGKPKRLWEEVYTPAVEHQKDVVALHHHAHRALAQWQGANQRSYELAVRTIEIGLDYMDAAYHYDATYWEDAVEVGREILPLAEQWPESLMLKEGSICNELGILLEAMGGLVEARSYHERALAIYEKVLGAEHPATATSLNNMGYLLQSMGELAEAWPYYARALAIHEKVLGADHPSTATSLNDLASLLEAKGEYAQAKPLRGRVLQIYESKLGKNHPWTATSLNNMGYLLRVMGELAEARPYYARALAIREKVLGAEHPDTATSLNNMGGLLRAMEGLAEARPYVERALAIREKVLGREHSDTAQSLHNLAWLCYEEGDYPEAARLMRRALAIWEQKLGPNHPQTQSARQSLAVIEAKLAQS